MIAHFYVFCVKTKRYFKLKHKVYTFVPSFEKTDCVYPVVFM